MNQPDMSQDAGMSASQAATLIERMSNMAETMRKFEAGQLKQTEMLISIATIQGEVKHVEQRIVDVEVISSQSRRDIEGIEKRMVSMQGWFKVAAWCAPFVLGFFAWGLLTTVGSIRDFDKMGNRVDRVDGRLTSIETIVGSKAIENTYDSPDPQQQSPPTKRRQTLP
jgi:hypothetical protein